MSGDVQPRKRKEKKLKREDESVPLLFYPKDINEDVNIHIHKDEGTGGGICAKIIFFILFSTLIVLIGLIITEHRGLTDLDVAESESRYSQLFEGWLDNEKLDDHHTLDDHDNEHFDDEEHDHDDGHTLDDHDDEHIDDQPNEDQAHTLDDHDEEYFDDDDQSNPPSEENDDDIEEATEESQEENRSEMKSGRYSEEEDDDVSGENVTESQQDLDETEEEELFANSVTKEEDEETSYSDDGENNVDDAENTEDDDAENFSDSQQYQQDTEEEQEAMEDSDVQEGTEEIRADSESEKDIIFSEKKENFISSAKDSFEMNDPMDDEEVESIQESHGHGGKSSQLQVNDEMSAENRSVSEEGFDLLEDSNESKELQEVQDTHGDTETEKVIHEQMAKAELSEDKSENSGGTYLPGSLSMIVKAIIGAAILAVGHFVLVKKWKSEYSDEEEISSGDYRVVPEVVKERYEQLRSSYSRSVSLESDTSGENNRPGSEDEMEIENIEDIEEEEEMEENEVEEEEEIQEGEIEEEEDYDEDDYEEEDDDELMKKLEAKYGKLKLDHKGIKPSPDQEESDSDKLSDDINDYEFSSITNEDDWHIHKELDEAQNRIPHNAAKALEMFEHILEKSPSSPRGFYGLAQALDVLAEMKKSNKLLEEAVINYLRISDLTNVPDALYKAAIERCIDRLRFRGNYGKAVPVHLKLIEKYPNDPKYRNQLVVTYLTIGRIGTARSLLEETLQNWPNDGCTLVHYGFIWKTIDNDLKKGVHYLRKGIDTKDPCVIDGRFYFHLGDALFRLGYKDEALKLYEDGVEHKLFPSKYQRSLYNIPHLTARPWWKEDQMNRYQSLFYDLVKNWQVIRNEGMSVLSEQGYFQDESENLRDTGDWKQFELFARGRKHEKNCNRTPFTCRMIESHPDASGCRRGQTKFSVMHPGTHVWAHCGPTNCRLRVHLGLKVPSQTFIRVGDDIRSWEEGKLIIFDDSFEHEVWHNGTDTRLVLIVDVWHPELSMTERKTLSSL